MNRPFADESFGTRLFSLNRSLGLAFALGAGADRNELRAMAKESLEHCPRWLARNLHKLAALGSSEIEALARELIERGHCREIARCAERAGLSLGKDLGMRLAKGGAAAEVFLRAGSFGLDGSKDLSALALLVCAEGHHRLVERAARRGASFDARVGLALAERDPGFVISRLSTFGISRPSDISELCLAALDRRDPYAVLAAIDSGHKVSSEVVCRLVEESPRRFAYCVAKRLTKLAMSDNAKSSRLAANLIEAGFDSAVLDAQRAGTLTLDTSIANRLLGKRTASAELGVIRNLSLFVPPAERSEHAALVGNLEFLAGVYGAGMIVDSQPDLAAPIWTALEPDLKLRAFSSGRAKLPRLSLHLADLIYPAVRAQKDELMALRLMLKLGRDLDTMVGRTGQSDTVSLSSPWYREIVEHVFPDHSNGYTDYERNEANLDRSRDLRGLRSRRSYPLCAFARETLQFHGRPQHRQAVRALVEELSEIASHAEEPGRLESLLLSAPAPRGASVEGRIAAIAIDALGSGGDRQRLRETLLLYCLRAEERPAEVFARIEERANPTGRHPFCSLRAIETFLASSTKIAAAKIARAAMSDPSLAPGLAEWYSVALQFLRAGGRNDAANRADPAKLERGARFLARIERLLDRPGLAAPERIRDVEAEARREPDARSLAAACLSVCRSAMQPERAEAALRSMIRSERTKIARCIGVVEGKMVDPSDIDLGNLDLSGRARAARTAVSAPDREALAAFLEMSLSEAFERDLETVERELRRYSPPDRSLAPIDLEGYFTKNHTSAHAPQAGGVCTTGEKGLWDTPSHFLFVLRDRKTKRCQGSVLCYLHEEDGKRMLSASFNPSSTYLMKVDQAALYTALKRVLCDFARMNSIDIVGVSSEPYIRSNRLDTPFEEAIEADAERRRTIRLKAPIVVSHEKQYYQRDLQVLWERGPGGGAGKAPH